MTQQRRNTDILVIGSGPGGAVMAYELQAGGRQVLVVEEGKATDQGELQPYSLGEMLHRYRNGGITAALGPTQVKYVEGRCMGGGSEVNSGLYFRTPADVIDRWRENYSVDEFSESQLLPHFVDCEKRVNVCSMPGKFPATSQKLVDGAAKMGWSCEEVPRWYRYDPIPDPSPVDGTRQSMSETYLPAFREAGGEMECGIKVVGLRASNGGWHVEARRADGSPLTIQAATVVVAAGAVQTPVLLRRSGFKNQVGNSFKMHTTAKLVARFPEAINSEQNGVAVHQVRHFAPSMTFGCAVSSAGFLGVSLLDNPDFDEPVSETWRNMASYYVMVSGGTGKVRSFPLRGDAMVWYSLPKDKKIDLAIGLKRLARLMFRAGANRIYPGINGMRSIASESDIHEIPNILDPALANLMTIHLMGSCPMGEDRSRTAVDSFGKVHGQEQLYVSDASLIADELGVNPQGTVMALARRNAHHLLANG